MMGFEEARRRLVDGLRESDILEIVTVGRVCSANVYKMLVF